MRVMEQVYSEFYYSICYEIFFLGYKVQDSKALLNDLMERKTRSYRDLCFASWSKDTSLQVLHAMVGKQFKSNSLEIEEAKYDLRHLWFLKVMEEVIEC